ncbi:MAG: glycosyltransferase, partial [Prevotella sp.]
MNNNRVCVVIPTYNNATTLASVVRGVAQHTPNIIVVNDGSTDDTAQL